MSDCLYLFYSCQQLPQQLTRRIPHRNASRHRCRRWTTCQIAHIISTQADGFHTGSLIGFLVEVLVSVGIDVSVVVVVVFGQLVSLLI